MLRYEFDEAQIPQLQSLLILLITFLLVLYADSLQHLSKCEKEGLFMNSDMESACMRVSAEL